MKYKTLAISKPEELIFGKALYPVTTPRGLVIGGGLVYPELNFTLPPIAINDANLENIRGQYQRIISDALERASHLSSNGVIFEFETLIEMTQKPAIGCSLSKAPVVKRYRTTP